MKRGVNKVILVGNLGNDPEARAMPSGGSVTNVSLATSESWKDKKTGQDAERTEWHKCVFFGPLADIVRDHARKGAKMYVEGSLRTRSWEGKDGQKRYTTEVICNEMQLLDGKSEEPRPDHKSVAAEQGKQEIGVLEDDIPF